MKKERKKLKEKFKLLEEKQETTNKGITLIALVVTIVVLLILAGVSITIVFGDNGIIQLAKEAADKTNEAVKNDLKDIENLQEQMSDIVNNGWSISKVTAVTSADGEIVPVPKGFVASGATGENIVSEGFVIYEGTDAVTDANVAKAREERNQFVWVPVDEENLQYAQDKTSWSTKTYEYNNYNDWWDEEEIDSRKESVEKYGGFYVGRYEAGVEDSKSYTNNSNYQRSASNKDDTSGTPVTKKNRQAWNFVTQTAAKTLSEKMYSNSTTVKSRLIDSYAWDTICKWFEKDKINVTDSTTWGNYYNASYKIKGLYAKHTYSSSWTYATQYSKTNDSETFTIPESKNNDRYEVATGVTVVDDQGKEIDRNKEKNIYDFAGNMWEWTTEIGDHKTAETAQVTETNEKTKPTGTYAVLRGGSFIYRGDNHPASTPYARATVSYFDVDFSFRPVLYIK